MISQIDIVFYCIGFIQIFNNFNERFGLIAEKIFKNISSTRVYKIEIVNKFVN